MLSVRSSQLYAVSIGLGVLFIGWIVYSMHFNIRWDWEAPGTGLLPQEVVEGYLDAAYDAGQGNTARAQYFAPEIEAASVPLLEAEDGAPIGREVHKIVAQGLNIVVFQSIDAARGEGAQDVVDLFEINRGRIAGRTRYVTGLDH